jgi:hypothetical protein
MKQYCTIGMALFLWVSGCDVVATDSLSPTVSLRTPVSEPIPPALGAHALLSHGDFDRLEEDLESQGKRAELVALYEELRQQRPDDVLLQVRGLFYGLRGGGFREASAIMEKITVLEKNHSKNPDVLFLSGMFHCARMDSGIVSGLGLPNDPLTGVFSTVDPVVSQGPAELERRREGVMAIVQAWGGIAMNHSEYVGPRGISAMELGLRAKAFLISMESHRKGERLQARPGKVSVGETEFWKRAVQFHMALRGGDKSGACQHGEEAFEALELGRATAAFLDERQMAFIQKWGLSVTLHTASEDIEVFRTFAEKTCGWN